MRIIFILFTAIYLNALTTARITDVNGLKITLDKPVQKGVSGVVLCPYQNEEIICAKTVSFGDYAKLYVYDNLKNDAFGLPLVYPKKGDKVIFGKNYSRVMIIAPNQTVYLKLKERFKNFTIIPIDVFAAFLDDLPTKENFINFTNKMDIGLYIFALDKLYYIDAESFYVINKEDYNFPKKFKIPFFSSYKFDIKEKDIINYYKKMLKGIND